MSEEMSEGHSLSRVGTDVIAVRPAQLTGGYATRRSGCDGVRKWPTTNEALTSVGKR